MKRNCFIFNIGGHYRKGIFQELDKDNNSDFYFGNKLKNPQNVKKINYSLLKNFKSELENKYIFNKIYYQKNVVRLFFKPYKNYIIFSEYFNISTWLIILMSKFSRKKIFIWTHGWYGNENFIKKIVKVIFFKLSDGIFVFGPRAKQYLSKYIKEDKIYIIYNSLDYCKQIKVRNKLINNHLKFIKEPKNYNLIFVGRLMKRKKLHLLIKSINEIINQGIEVKLNLVGAGEDRARLESLTKKLNLNRYVKFLGEEYDENKLGELFFSSDLCISPGSVGLTAIHSMMYGTPVISHSDFKNQAPEYEAIVKNLTGDFFDFEIKNDLSNKIINWIQNQNRQTTRLHCFEMIDTYYNPSNQLKILKESIKF